MGNVIKWVIAHKDTIIAVATMLYSEFQAGNPNTKYQGIVRSIVGSQPPDQLK